MTRMVFNEQTLADIGGTDGVIEVCDGSGRVVGYYYPARPDARSPYSRAQLEEFRNQRTGRPLAEVLAELEKR